jgi:hypothetical protein
MKWLIVTHRLVQLPTYFAVMQDIYTSLGDMNAPLQRSAFENYLYETLLKIYTQYLQKLCIIRVKEQTIIDLSEEEQDQDQLFYLRYNLLQFATR